MIRQLLERAGVDYVQWRALTRVALKNDLRRQVIAAHQRGESARGNRGIPGQIFIYVIYGLFFSGIVVAIPDQFLGALLVITYACFTVATTVLLEFSTVVTAPEDYVILGFQPVSSRTFFAARLTNLLGFVSAIMLAFGVVPSIAIALRHQFNPSIGAALLIGIWSAGVTTALSMVLLYGTLLRRIRPARLKRALSYLQLVASFIVYGGYIIVPRLVAEMHDPQRVFEKTWWVMLYPVSWFSSWVDIGSGNISANTIVPVLLSLALMVWVARAAVGKLSLEFAEKLGALLSVTSGNQKAPRPTSSWSPFKLREPRAVWLLVRAQFRSDQRFRMGVLATVPMTVVYMIMSVMEGQMRDPFEGARSAGGLVNMAILIFPAILGGVMTQSEHYSAAWIFFATPADREETVLALRKTVFFLFVLPYIAIYSMVLSIWVHNVAHVVVHALVLALISNLFLNARTVITPELPFSRPPLKGERTAGLIAVMMLSGIVAAGAIPLVIMFVYISAQRTAALIAALALTGYVLDRFGRARIRREILQYEFAG